jgi:enoyl-CoA hydratase/carnithine racemase
VVGVARTKELFLLGRNMDASHAAAIGLVNEVVAASEIDQAGVALAAEVAEGAPLAARGNKLAIETLARNPVLTPEQERELVELRRSCFTSEDFREGIAAFAERRKPRWQGR